MVKSSEVFKTAENPDIQVKEVKSWLGSKGVRNFEPVSLFCDQLKKVSVILCLLHVSHIRTGHSEGD